MSDMYKNIASDLSGKCACGIVLLFMLIAVTASFFVGDPAVIPEGGLPYKAPGYVIAKTGEVMTFGTDQIGRDVLAGVMYGARWALIVGFLATLISACIGISFGVVAGYFGDTDFKVNMVSVVIAIFLWSIMCFYVWYMNWGVWIMLIVFSLSSFVIILLLYKIHSNRLFIRFNIKNNLSLPLDFIILRLIEIWRAIPALFILLAILVAVNNPSLWTVVVVIGVLRWTSIARLVRAEFLSIRNMNYIRTAKSIGYSDFRIILKHGLPNAIAPLFVLFAFSVSSAIILEATLSFLGIGVSVDTVTWGSLMSAARQNYRAWWLVLIPGLCIFFLVLSLNVIGDRLAEQR